VHPIYGAFWNDNGFMVKEENDKCRCKLVQKLDLSDLIVKAQIILENLVSMVLQKNVARASYSERCGSLLLKQIFKFLDSFEKKCVCLCLRGGFLLRKTGAASKLYIIVMLAVIVIVAIVGAFAITQLGLLENNSGLSPAPTPVPTASLVPGLTPTPSITVEPSVSLSPTSTVPSTPLPISTPPVSPSITSTPTPSPAPTFSPLPTSTPTATAVTKTVNWAGYAVSSDLQNPQPIVLGITASWNVPAVAASANDTFSAVWIGIGGQFGQTLIQCGTKQDFINGKMQYAAWYELLPSTSVTIRMINVSPGDLMQASIQLSDATLNQWVLNLTDRTNGQSFQRIFTYASSQLWAEWIVERPTVNNVISHLANFGTITFFDCTATLGSTTGKIGSFPANKVVMYSSTLPGSSSLQLTDVLALNTDLNGFTINYLASG
jgi:hypothetical protein